MRHSVGRFTSWSAVGRWPFTHRPGCSACTRRPRPPPLLSPFVVSFTGVGFEHGAYLWIGGAELWTQLLGSWALPFAWAATWRAMKDARFIWVAAALVGLTVGLHFMCGYLAFLGVFVLGLAAEGG